MLCIIEALAALIVLAVVVLFVFIKSRGDADMQVLVEKQPM